MSLSSVVGRRLGRGRIGVVAAVVIHNGIGPHLNYLFYHRIEGRTARALNPEKVPLSSMRLGFTIVAHDIDNSLKIGWHGVFGDIPGSCLPGRCHGLLTNNRLFANGASVIEPRQLPKAMSVNGVSTRQILGRLATAEHVFTAYGAVVFILVLEALMRLKDRDRDAHAAFVAMAKRLDPSHTAKATLHAVKRLFGLFVVD